jgi:hypothetical protein
MYMKRNILFALLCACTIPAIAQEENDELTTPQPLPKVRTRELGIMTQMAGSEIDMNMIGVQFKTYKNERKAFRFMAAYGNYHSFNNNVIAVGSDSVTEVHSLTKVDLPIIGVGVEMQRHFWRKVYLFAGVELRGGYGKGSLDTMISSRPRSVQGPGNISGSPFIPQDVSLTYIAASPSIGAKIVGKRIGVGVELMPVNLSFRNVSYEKGPSSDNIDFNAAIFQQRLFVYYRF